MKCLPDKVKKWTSLFGGFLLSFVFGSNLTFSNMSPYMISYIRFNDSDMDLRYAKSIWLGITNTIALKCGSLLAGFLFSSKIIPINLKAFILFGCILFSAGTALTYFTLKISFLLTNLTYGVLNGKFKMIFKRPFN